MNWMVVEFSEQELDALGAQERADFIRGRLDRAAVCLLRDAGLYVSSSGILDRDAADLLKAYGLDNYAPSVSPIRISLFGKTGDNHKFQVTLREIKKL